jgi:hypothetical protein
LWQYFFSLSKRPWYIIRGIGRRHQAFWSIFPFAPRTFARKDDCAGELDRFSVHPEDD